MSLGIEKKTGGRSMGVEMLAVHIPTELKKLVGVRADEEKLPMNEFVARILAESLDRPDLAKIPRKRSGRPRKEIGNASA